MAVKIKKELVYKLDNKIIKKTFLGKKILGFQIMWDKMSPKEH